MNTVKSTLKVAILANNADSFPKPMAEGLHRMFQSIGVTSEILYEGLNSLPPSKRRPTGEKRQTWQKTAIAYGRGFFREVAFRRLVRKLKGFQVAVIIGHLPVAYYESFFDDRRLRRALPHLPIILYDLIYLGTNRWWIERLASCDVASRVPQGQHYGLNRYDHYLCVNEMNGNPLLPGCGGYHRVGIDLQDPALRLQQPKEFTALIDFERPQHLRERSDQVSACVEAEIPFQVLHGSYAMSDIRAIYRSTSVYFLAHDESFGLPICEVQACGGVVLTPHEGWCKAHYVTNDNRTPVRLPDNIIPYNNNKAQLVQVLKGLRANFDPKENLRRFKATQPHYYSGDSASLSSFVEDVLNQKITSRSHESKLSLDQMMRNAAEQDSESDTVQP